MRAPLSERSTTGSWSTTLLARRARSGSDATSCPASRAVPAVGTIVVVSMPIVDTRGAVRAARAAGDRQRRGGLVVPSGEGLRAVIGFTVSSGRIGAIDLIADPDKLAGALRGLG